MTNSALTADEVAHFLKTHPDFFTQHADIFADLRIPHPHETRAISLGERQILTLRNRCKELEWKLAGLIHNASGNERIASLLMQWCCEMLEEDDACALPPLMARRLHDIFEVPEVVLRLWDKHGPAPYVQQVGEALRQYAESLGQPYCGPSQACPAAEWLKESARSMACITLRDPDTQTPFGLLVLGSDDPERFTVDMATDYLVTIGKIASAGLQRLPSDITSETQVSST